LPALIHAAQAATATPGAVFGAELENLAGGVAEIIAVIRAVRIPADRWAHGRCSKTAAVLAALFVGFHSGLVFVPLGAAAVWVHTTKLARQPDPRPDPAPVPLADGEAEPVSKEAA
jgi:hypothetical protein